MSKQLFTIAVLLLLVACRSSDPGDYSPKVVSQSADQLIVTVDVPHSISAEGLTRLLLRDAARTAIDRGAVYLRVDRVTIGEASAVMREVRPAPPPVTLPLGDVASASAVDKVLTALQEVNVTYERHRSGSLSMTISGKPLAGDNAFEASKLLDELRESDAVPLSQ